MKGKRRLRSGHRKADLQEAFALCLNQKRHDAQGKRLPGYSSDEIMEMTPAQREQVKQAGWLGKSKLRRQ
jgi:hypothetical protein